MSIMMLTRGRPCLPHGHARLPGWPPHRRGAGQEAVPRNSVEMLMTNPPFGSDITIDEPMSSTCTGGRTEGELLVDGDRRAAASENRVAAIAPEQLFIQRAVEGTAGGKTGIVLRTESSNSGPTDAPIPPLDSSLLGARGDRVARRDVHRRGRRQHLTSLLFLKKKTGDEIRQETQLAQHGPASGGLPRLHGGRREGCMTARQHRLQASPGR